MSGWMKTPWSIAHRVVDGRILCGTDLSEEALQPARNAVQCGTCEVVAARLATPAVRRVRVRIARPVPPPKPVRPAAVCLGPDPLVAVLHRYERGQL